MTPLFLVAMIFFAWERAWLLAAITGITAAFGAWRYVKLRR